MMSRAYWQRWKPVAVMLGAALMCVACNAKPVATPATPTAVEPPVKSQMSAPPVSSQPLTSAPPPQVTPTRDTARAQALLEQGWRHQQTHGQDGANEAIALYEAGLSADPQCAACYWERGWSKQLQGDWNGCIEDWDRVRALDPDFPELDHHYPVALMRRDQAQSLSALPTLDRLLPPELEPRPGPTLSVNAVGDINMGRAWPRHLAKLPPNGARDFFTHVTDPLRRADITFGNLETVLQDEGDSSKCQPTSTKCFAFRVPTAYSAVPRDAGFDVLSLANNHTGDFGEAGRRDTMAALDRVGIYHSGPVGDIATWEIRGLRVALIAFATGGGVYRLHHLETAQRLIADVDRQHDLVFVSFHGAAEGTAASRVPHGVEYAFGENRGDVRAFSRAVIDAGADLVLEHGPHVLRGMELYRERLIAYSLGNFSTWRTFNLRGPLGISVILEVQLATNGVLLNATLHPIVIEQPGRPAPDPLGRAITLINTLSKQDFGTSIFKSSWPLTNAV